MLDRTEGTRSCCPWYDYNTYDDGVIPPAAPSYCHRCPWANPSPKSVNLLPALFLYQSGPTDYGDLSFHHERSARKNTHGFDRELCSSDKG